MIDVMRSWANGTNSGTTPNTLGTSYAAARIPIWALPENGDGNFAELTKRVIDPWEMNWAIWSSLIHGAQQIIYFAYRMDSSPQTHSSPGNEYPN